MCPNADHTFSLWSPAKVMKLILQQRAWPRGQCKVKSSFTKQEAFNRHMEPWKRHAVWSASWFHLKSTTSGAWRTRHLPYRTQSSSYSLNSPAANTGLKKCFRTSIKPVWIPAQGSVGKRKVRGGARRDCLSYGCEEAWNIPVLSSLQEAVGEIPHHHSREDEVFLLKKKKKSRAWLFSLAAGLPWRPRPW